jgi:hypothetical protein
MTTVDQVESLFGPGPFPHFQRSLGLFRPVGTNIVPRALTCVLIGWFPLLVLVVFICQLAAATDSLLRLALARSALGPISRQDSQDEIAADRSAS